MKQKLGYIILGFISLLMLVLLTKVFIFALIGMGPAIVCYLIDWKPGKNTFQTVAYFNLAGVSIKCMDFIQNISSLTLAEAMSPKNLLLAYSFAAMGYFVVWLVPKVIVIMVDYKNQRRSIVINEKVEKLVEEWGPEVKK